MFENMEKIIIGIDPGIKGGIAIYENGKIIEAVKMPFTPAELFHFLKEKTEGKQACCYLEKVQGMPGQGANAMFTFGKGFGHLEMALIACNIPTYEVTPQKWQKTLQVGNKGTKTKAEWKNKLKAKAEMLYPYLGKQITLATSDAILICHYGVINEK